MPHSERRQLLCLQQQTGGHGGDPGGSENSDFFFELISCTNHVDDMPPLRYVASRDYSNSCLIIRDDEIYRRLLARVAFTNSRCTCLFVPPHLKRHCHVTGGIATTGSGNIDFDAAQGNATCNGCGAVLLVHHQVLCLRGKAVGILGRECGRPSLFKYTVMP
jgi:hypothetical protein